MNIFNIAMDLIMAPLRLLPAELALACYSILTGMVILLLFKVSSAPAKIAAARDRALARVLELWLFREDAVGGLLSVGRAMLNSLGYLSTMLRPALVSILPMLIMLIQANAWFGNRALRQGETALLTARVAQGSALRTLALETPDNITVEATVSCPEINEKVWRIRVNEINGSDVIKIIGRDINATKLIATGDALMRASLLRTARRGEHLLFPDEPLLHPPLEEIRIAYQPASYSFLGVEMPWIVYLLIVSLITGLILKKPFGVEF